MIVKHLPILQVLIPLCGALFSLLSFNKNAARIISSGAIILAVLLSTYSLFFIKIDCSYFFGDWAPRVGIEYKLDFLNRPIIAYVNIVLLFSLLFCHKFFQNSVMDHIKDSRQNLFYTILLFVHTGYIGVLSTNDLFNLYVFLEISSISGCILIAQGGNPRAVVGSFDYLILGTIGTTLILIGIGFLFSKTGSLNISYIKEHLTKDMYNSNVIMAGAAFFIIGSILKMAFFPMHFWMVRAYQAVPSIILTYFAGVSGIIGSYIFLRFINFVFDYAQIQNALSWFLNPIALFTMTLCSWFAFRAENLKKIIIYSSAAQLGYAVLLFSIGNNYNIVLQFLVIDSINKVAMFLIIATFEDAGVNLNLDTISSIDGSNKLLRILVALNLICSSSLPISSMFIIKVNIIELLIRNNLFLSLIVALIASTVSLLYHYKIARALLFENNTAVVFDGKLYNLAVITIMQFLVIPLFYVIQGLGL